MPPYFPHHSNIHECCNQASTPNSLWKSEYGEKETRSERKIAAQRNSYANYNVLIIIIDNKLNCQHFSAKYRFRWIIVAHSARHTDRNYYCDVFSVRARVASFPIRIRGRMVCVCVYVSPIHGTGRHIQRISDRAHAYGAHMPYAVVHSVQRITIARRWTDTFDAYAIAQTAYIIIITHMCARAWGRSRRWRNEVSRMRLKTQYKKCMQESYGTVRLTCSPVP